MKKIILISISGLFLVFIFFILSVMFDETPSVMETVVHNSSLPHIEIDGVLLHAETFGNPEKPMIIVLHGGPGGDYRALLPLTGLADSFFVVFYDQRGSGLSERVSEDQLTLEKFGEELKGVIEYYAKGKPVYLLGHSWGGMLGTYFIGKYGRMVEKALFIEPGFLTQETFEEVYRRTNGFMPRNPSLQMGWSIVKAALRSLRITGPDDHARRDYITWNIMNSSTTESPIAGYFCGADTRNGKLEFWRVGGACMKLLADLNDSHSKVKFDLSDGLQNFDKPVLLMAGACNVLIGEDIQKKHLKLFKNAELKVVPGAGHTMIGEKPEEVLALIRHFFSAELD